MNSGRFSRLEVGHDLPEAQVTPLAGVPVRTSENDMALADTAYRSGNFEPALQLYTRALRGDRARVAAWVGQVQMLVELGEYAEARLWSDKALELFRNNGELLAAKAWACTRDGDPTAAMACSDASLQAAGSSPARWRIRGEVLLSRKSKLARDCFEKALAEREADHFQRICVARVYMFRCKPAPAYEYAKAATHMKPEDPYCHYVLGECERQLGQVGRAAASWQRCLDLDVNHRGARLALTSLEYQSPWSRFANSVKGMLKR